jgi:hypothetical protein
MSTANDPHFFLLYLSFQFLLPSFRVHRDIISWSSLLPLFFCLLCNGLLRLFLQSIRLYFLLVHLNYSEWCNIFPHWLFFPIIFDWFVWFSKSFNFAPILNCYNFLTISESAHPILSKRSFRASSSDFPSSKSISLKIIFF